MERRQNGGRRRYIVQQFLTAIGDDTERLVCFLFLNGYKNTGICRILHLKPKELYKIKVKIGEALKAAGIEVPED